MKYYSNSYRGVTNLKKGVTNSVTNLATIDNNSLENATIINRDPNPLIVKKHRIEEEYKHKKQNNYLIINALKKSCPQRLVTQLFKINKTMERRERDSNPRCLSARRFSRPL